MNGRLAAIIPPITAHYSRIANGTLNTYLFLVNVPVQRALRSFGLIRPHLIDLFRIVFLSRFCLPIDNLVASAWGISCHAPASSIFQRRRFSQIGRPDDLLNQNGAIKRHCDTSRYRVGKLLRSSVDLMWSCILATRTGQRPTRLAL
jgi:hypothetical protein